MGNGVGGRSVSERENRLWGICRISRTTNSVSNLFTHLKVFSSVILAVLKSTMSKCLGIFYILTNSEKNKQVKVRVSKEQLISASTYAESDTPF